MSDLTLPAICFRVFCVFLFSLASALAQETGIAPAMRQSGFEAMSPETRAMQSSDLANPGMLWVREGEKLWQENPGNGRQACAGCHGPAPMSMRGVSARYPAFDAAKNQPVDLAGRIEQCRSERQDKADMTREQRALLAMTSYIGHQSRGNIISPTKDERLAKAVANGKALFSQRIGQLNLSCAGCHDDIWGRKLGSAVIPQGHPNGYPIYRLEWQALGSLQRRIRNCMTGVRAEPLAYGAREMIELELYLMQRAEGLRVETPAVRP